MGDAAADGAKVKVRKAGRGRAGREGKGKGNRQCLPQVGTWGTQPQKGEAGEGEPQPGR